MVAVLSFQIAFQCFSELLQLLSIGAQFGIGFHAGIFLFFHFFIVGMHSVKIDLVRIDSFLFEHIGSAIA